MTTEQKRGMPLQQEAIFKIFIGKSHREPPQVVGRINGNAPSGYAFAIIGGGLNARHWGYGGEKNTEAMFAHGLIRALDIILIECTEPTMHIVMDQIGTQKYFDEFVPKWFAAPELHKDNIETWKKAYVLNNLGKLEFREPSKDCQEEYRFTDAAQAQSRRVAKIAAEEFRLNRPRFADPGILMTDEDASAPKLDWE